MSEILQSMGIKYAFDMDLADFSGLAQSELGNIYISRVLHKTFIAVDEKGTRAGAATAVEMACGSAAPLEKPKIVYLDRPFVYMLIDCETDLPFFIGAMMDPGE
jgi:serpin B